MFKVKKTWDVDVAVIKRMPTASGTMRYQCATSEGDIVGTTYAQSYLKDAKPGDIIRVMVTEVNRKWDKNKKRYIYHWFSPVVKKPGEAKEGLEKDVAKKASKADSNKVLREIWITSRGLSPEEVRKLEEEKK